MADGELMLASAVVIPDATDIAPESEIIVTPSLKRRQTEALDPETTKRLRLSPDSNAPSTTAINSHVQEQVRVVDARPLPETAPTTDNPSVRRTDRRQSGREEERRRGQRMFGALLGALSAGGSSARTGTGVQKRRADIEKRTQAKLQEIDQNEKKKEKEQFERIRRQRRREQWIVDEQAMKTRHDNLLATARFLWTKAEPRLYYKPWELSIEEIDQITRQIDEATEQVDRERGDFEYSRRNGLKELDDLVRRGTGNDQIPPTQQSGEDSNMVGSEPPKETNEPRSPIVEDTNPAPPAIHSTPLDSKRDDMETVDAAVADEPDHEEMDEHHGETVLEAEEDTVIY